MCASIDPSCVESLVDVLVTIHRRVERGARFARGTGDATPASPIDAALSVADLDAVAGATAPVRLATDGGDDRLATREAAEGLLVVVDVRGITRNDHETEVDASGDSLVITIDQRFAWRVPVEGDPTSITDVSVNNDVLEVRVSLDR